MDANGHADVLVGHPFAFQFANDLDEIFSNLRLQINLLRPAFNYRLWSKEVTKRQKLKSPGPAVVTGVGSGLKR